MSLSCTHNSCERNSIVGIMYLWTAVYHFIKLTLVSTNIQSLLLLILPHIEHILTILEHMNSTQIVPSVTSLFCLHFFPRVLRFTITWMYLRLVPNYFSHLTCLKMYTPHWWNIVKTCENCWLWHNENKKCILALCQKSYSLFVYVCVAWGRCKSFIKSSASHNVSVIYFDHG